MHFVIIIVIGIITIFAFVFRFNFAMLWHTKLRVLLGLFGHSLHQAERAIEHVQDFGRGRCSIARQGLDSDNVDYPATGLLLSN